MPSPSRRRFLVGLAASPFALSCSATATPRPPSDDEVRRRPLPIPPLADSTVDGDGTRTFTLRAAPGATAIVAGTTTATWGYNGSILGPTLRARDGEAVAVDVRERTARTHHRALARHAPARPVRRRSASDRRTRRHAGSPAWTIRQPAATLWYHPHPHGETEKHIYRGLAGLFIVDDDASPDALPHDYGVDDIPLIIQDRRFTASGALDESDPTDVGLLGDTIVTNGIAGAIFTVRHRAGSAPHPQRFRRPTVQPGLRR